MLVQMTSSVCLVCMCRQKPTRRRVSGRSKQRAASSAGGRALKSTGVKVIDDVFKEPQPTLRQCVALRDGVDAALTAYKEQCGVADSSNLKQCIRALASRVHLSCDSATLQLHFKDDVSMQCLFVGLYSLLAKFETQQL